MQNSNFTPVCVKLNSQTEETLPAVHIPVCIDNQIYVVSHQDKRVITETRTSYLHKIGFPACGVPTVAGEFKVDDVRNLLNPNMSPIEEYPLLIEVAKRCQPAEPMDVDPPFMFHFEKATSTSDFYPLKCFGSILAGPCPKVTKFSEKGVNTSDKVEEGVQTEKEQPQTDAAATEELNFIATSRKGISEPLVESESILEEIFKHAILSFTCISLYEAGAALTLCCN